MPGIFEQGQSLAAKTLMSSYQVRLHGFYASCAGHSGSPYTLMEAVATARSLFVASRSWMLHYDRMSSSQTV